MSLNGSDVTDNGTNMVKDAQESPPDPDAYLYDLGTNLFLWIDMFLVIFGCTGNLLTFLVCTRKRMRSSPVSVFIGALALFDTVVLILDWMNNWLELGVNIQPLKNYEFCLFHRWFFNVAYTTSAWYVAAVAVERLIAVCSPLTSKIWCTVKNSLIAVVVIPIIICIIYIYNLWMWEPAVDSKCQVGSAHSFFMNEVSPWLSAVIYSYLPLLVILVASIAIVARLIAAGEKRKAMTGDASADKETKKVTMTVLAICAAFLCLTVPLTIWYIYIFATGQFANPGPRIVFIEIVILIVGLSNHSINFFLYIMTSARFRSELQEMVCCCQKASGTAADNQQGASRTKSTNLSGGSSQQSISSDSTSVAVSPSADP